MYWQDLEIMPHTDSTSPRQPAERDATTRKPWVAPSVTELPKLQNLTLQTGSPIGGNQSAFP